MHKANEFLENEYWPEWNEKFTKPPKAPEDMHRPLPTGLDLAAALSHVEQRVITNDYTFAFAGKRYQIASAQVKPGMKRQSLRVELRLNGDLKARHQGQYLEINECGSTSSPAAKPSPGRVARWRNSRRKIDVLCT